MDNQGNNKKSSKLSSLLSKGREMEQKNQNEQYITPPVPSSGATDEEQTINTGENNESLITTEETETLKSLKKERNFQDFFIRDQNYTKDKKTTVSIRSEPLRKLNVICTVENINGPGVLIDNIVADWLERYEKDINKAMKKFKL